MSSRLEQKAYQACKGARFEELLGQVVARDLDPYAAAERIFNPSGEGG